MKMKDIDNFQENFLYQLFENKNEFQIISVIHMYEKGLL